MKKGINLPKQIKSFFDNYKALLVAAVLIISNFTLHSQYDSTKQLQPVNGHGNKFKNGEFTGSIILPKDTVKMAVRDSGAMSFKNGLYYGWTGYRWAVFAGGGSDATKLNVIDTTGKWISFMYKKDGTDSVFTCKNGTCTFSFLAGSGGGSDNWGSQVVEKTTNLTGSGTSASPLDVNTANISTVQRVLDSITAVKIIAALKLNTADSVFMLANYKHWLQGYLKAADIAGKMNYSDSVLMLDAYKNAINLKLNSSDTLNKWVNNIHRNATNDSIIFYVGNQRLAFKSFSKQPRGSLGVRASSSYDTDSTFEIFGGIGDVNDANYLTPSVWQYGYFPYGSTVNVRGILVGIKLGNTSDEFYRKIIVKNSKENGEDLFIMSSEGHKIDGRDTFFLKHLETVWLEWNNDKWLVYNYYKKSYSDSTARAALSANFPLNYNSTTGVHSADTSATASSLVTNNQLKKTITDSLNANFSIVQLGSSNGLPLISISGDTLKARNLLAGYCINLSQVGDSVMRLDIDSACMALKFLRITDTSNLKPRLVAGTNITITGTYPNLTISASGGGSGSQTPYTSDHDAAQNKVDNIKAISVYKAGSGGGGLTYSTWNPSDKGSNITLSNGNLTADITDASQTMVRSTIGVNSNKHYIEVIVSAVGTRGASIGIANSTATLNGFTGQDANGWGLWFLGGDKINNFIAEAYAGGNINDGDVIGVLLDMDNLEISFRKNNSAFGVAYTLSAGTYYVATGTFNANTTVTANFGATAFTYSVPSGYRAGLYTGSASTDTAWAIVTDTTGKVGIGKNNPTQALDVHGVIKTDSSIILNAGQSIIDNNSKKLITSDGINTTDIADNNWDNIVRIHGFGGTSLEVGDASVIVYNATLEVGGSVRINDTLDLRKVRIVADSDSGYVKDPITKKMAYAKINGVGGGSMVYPPSGIAVSTGSAWGTSITDNSANWNTAHTDRLKWDGGSTGLVAATGRASLELENVTNESKATMFTSPTLTGTATVSGSLALSGVTTPAVYTTNQDDVDPGTNAVLRVSSDADSRIITSISGGTAGRLLTIENIGVPDIILSHDDGTTGTAANRFDFNGTDLIIPSKSVRILQYDATLTRWVAAGREDNNDAQRRMPIVSWDYMLAGVATANFSTNLIASGTATYVNGVTDHPGYMTITSSTTTNSGAYSLMHGLNSMHAFKGGELYECVFQPKVASNTNTTMRFGFLDATTSADAVDGAYFEIPAGSFAVVGKTANNSTRTTSATIATVAVNTWYRAQIRVNRAASSITFTLYDANGVSLGSQTNSANIPTASGREFGSGFIATNVGTSATLLAWLDYQSVQLGAGKPINR